MSDTLALQTRDGTMTATLQGELRAVGVPEVREELLSAIAQEEPQVLEIDMANVPFIDSSGLAMLVEAKRRMGKKPLRVLRPMKSVREMIRILRLDTLFEMREDATHD